MKNVRGESAPDDRKTRYGRTSKTKVQKVIGTMLALALRAKHLTPLAF